MIIAFTALAAGVLACMGLAAGARRLVDTLRPALAVPLLTVAALAVSVSVGVVLCAIGFVVVAALAPIAQEEGWSAPVLQTLVPIPAWAGALAAGAAGLLLGRSIWRAVGITRTMLRADRICRDMRSAGARVVIIDDDTADAYTVGGFRGCVVISRQLMASLTPGERTMLTAHELSHLNRRHHLYLHVVDLAAAANPLLGRVSQAARYGVERWADEDAAAVLGDRVAAARALARVALTRSTLRSTRSGHARPTPAAGLPVLAAAATHVIGRVQALLSPARCSVTVPAITVAVLAAALLVISGETTLQIHHALEHAESILAGP